MLGAPVGTGAAELDGVGGRPGHRELAPRGASVWAGRLQVSLLKCGVPRAGSHSRIHPARCWRSFHLLCDARAPRLSAEHSGHHVSSLCPKPTELL